MSLKLTWTTLLFCLTVLGLGHTSNFPVIPSKHCHLNFNLHHMGYEHEWENFKEVDIGLHLFCPEMKTLCSGGAMKWTDEFFGQIVPPINTGTPAKMLCDYYNIELLPEHNATVDLTWGVAKSCGTGGPNPLGQLCCDRVLHNGEAFIIPNDGCQTSTTSKATTQNIVTTASTLSTAESSTNPVTAPQE